MPIPYRERTDSPNPDLRWEETDDGSLTLWDATIDESFHSGCGAVSESLVVYLRNTGIWDAIRNQRPASVLEFGFGTATSFLLTAAAAQTAKALLRYRSFEVRLLPADFFLALDLWDRVDSKLLRQLPGFVWPVDVYCDALRSVSEQLAAIIDSNCLQPGLNQFSLSPYVKLELILEDIVETAETERPDVGARRFDAIYFDPFSPDSNPELWTKSVFQYCHARLTETGVFATYCVKGAVRRTLNESGFEVKKLPGPVGGKREVLVARRGKEVVERVGYMPGD